MQILLHTKSRKRTTMIKQQELVVFEISICQHQTHLLRVAAYFSLTLA